jgi:hypothetical protein
MFFVFIYNIAYQMVLEQPSKVLLSTSQIFQW